MMQEDMSNLKACMEVCGIVNMPTRDMLWDGKSEFKKGIAYIRRAWMGEDTRNFAVVGFNRKYKNTPYIIKDFNGGTMGETGKIDEIFVIPEYPTNVQRNIPTGADPVMDQLNSPYSNRSDVDDTTKFEPNGEIIEAQLPWVIPGIHSEDEAREWLKTRGYKSVHLYSKETIIAKINESILKDETF